MRNKKGFLGPIGDDLPSLIPLIFALMLFFYVFTFTWNAFDQRSQSFNDALAALRIGNTIKGNNYLEGMDSFLERCSEAKSAKRINFVAGLIPLSTGSDPSFSGIDIETIEENFFGQGEEKFLCKNTEEKVTAESENLVMRSFPIALEFKNRETNAFYVRPMLLVVVSWR